MKKKLAQVLAGAMAASILISGCGVQWSMKDDAASEESGEEENMGGCMYVVEDDSEEDASSEESTEDSDDEAFLDFEELGIEKYEYPDEFVMGDNLKAAIEELALMKDEFHAETEVYKDYWEESFIHSYLKNSWFTFDYLAEDEDGLLTKEQVEYVNYSLTGMEYSFDSLKDNDTVDTSEASSGFGWGELTDYTYEGKQDFITVTANFTYQSAEMELNYVLTVELVKNVYSCFDGYSIISLTKAENFAEADGQEHQFYAYFVPDYVTDDGYYAFEYSGTAEDLAYSHFVYVSLTDEQLALVESDEGAKYLITFVFSEGMSEPIEKVEAFSVELATK
ncbi:hypothetical protein [Butyrivibrio proteoclasticus]|uniref:hypothetical protein n=1 Tax=Butyrivibrio proteoclasticus TaxID=43305 RepID=UPI000478E089|nr:hypothetical protein [Butyrivibrio proteoclasticus]